MTMKRAYTQNIDLKFRIPKPSSSKLVYPIVDLKMIAGSDHFLSFTHKGRPIYLPPNREFGELSHTLHIITAVKNLCNLTFWGDHVMQFIATLA